MAYMIPNTKSKEKVVLTKEHIGMIVHPGYVEPNDDVGLIYTPIEKEVASDLGIVSSLLCKRHIAGQVVRVYYTVAERETAELLNKDLEAQMRKEARMDQCILGNGTRCQKPRKACENCPHYLKEGRTGLPVELDISKEIYVDTPSKSLYAQVTANMDYEDFVATLNERDQKLLQLYQADRTQKQIAQALGISQPAVHKALIRIAKKYQERYC